MTISSANRLKIYNDALQTHLGERATTLTEDRKPRRLLDAVWDRGGIDECLGAGQWSFAKRLQQIDYNPSITPAFGYAYAFDLPSDWVQTTGLCSDDHMNAPILSMSMDANYIYCDLQTIYLEYISNDSAYGGDYSRWSNEFIRFVGAYFASQIVYPLTQSRDDQKKLMDIVDKLKTDAQSSDAMNQGPKFAPAGSWVQSRSGQLNVRDRTGRSLIG